MNHHPEVVILIVLNLDEVVSTTKASQLANTTIEGGQRNIPLIADRDKLSLGVLSPLLVPTQRRCARSHHFFKALRRKLASTAFAGTHADRFNHTLREAFAQLLFEALVLHAAECRQRIPFFRPRQALVLRFGAIEHVGGARGHLAQLDAVAFLIRGVHEPRQPIAFLIESEFGNVAHEHFAPGRELIEDKVGSGGLIVRRRSRSGGCRGSGWRGAGRRVGRTAM